MQTEHEDWSLQPRWPTQTDSSLLLASVTQHLGLLRTEGILARGTFPFKTGRSWANQGKLVTALCLSLFSP